MKKVWVVIALLIVTLCTPSVSSALNKMWWASGLTGGGGALDGIDGASLTDGDGAFVVWKNGTTNEGSLYRLEAYVSDPPAESSPLYITPNANAGNKRWVLTKYYGNGFDTARTDNPGCTTLYEATSDGDAYVQLCAFAKGTGYATGTTGLVTVPPISGPLMGSCTVTHNYAGGTTQKDLTVNESHCSFITVSNAGGAATITIPAAIPGKDYTVYNGTSYTLTFKVSGGAGGTIGAGHYAKYTSHATDVIETWEQ